VPAWQAISDRALSDTSTWLAAPNVVVMSHDQVPAR
jgi:hypothetical protein